MLDEFQSKDNLEGKKLVFLKNAGNIFYTNTCLSEHMHMYTFPFPTDF